MFYYIGILIVGIVITTLSPYSYTYTMRDRIEKIFTITDVIHFLQHISKDSSTEDIVDNIVSEIRREPLKDDVMQRISRLHMAYANDLGIKGYAINMLWSSILKGNESIPNDE